MRSRERPTEKPPSANETCTQFRRIERSIPASVCITFFSSPLFFFFIIRGRTTRHYRSESDDEKGEKKKFRVKSVTLYLEVVLVAALNVVGLSSRGMKRIFDRLFHLIFPSFTYFSQSIPRKCRKCKSFFNSISVVKRLRISNLRRIYDDTVGRALTSDAIAKICNNYSNESINYVLIMNFADDWWWSATFMTNA